MVYNVIASELTNPETKTDILKVIEISAQDLQADDFVSWLCMRVSAVIAFLFDLLTATSLSLRHGVDGLQVGGVRQHSDTERVSRPKVQLQRGG